METVRQQQNNEGWTRLYSDVKENVSFIPICATGPRVSPTVAGLCVEEVDKRASDAFEFRTLK